jgi:sugar phosphate isomerase/epimerase
VQIGLGADAIELMHAFAWHFHVKQSAQGEFKVKPDADNGAIDFKRLIGKLQADNYDGVVTVEFVAQACWDMQEETAKMKKVIEDALV